ncbi:MAG: PAS domain S-box protein [Bacteroidetes bacterium]|nr:PAS domain S-box protein [Bacteroidota bacterium]
MDIKKKNKFGEKKQFLFLTLILTILIIIAGYFYYDKEEKKIRGQKQNELKAIAQLKINQISEWYKDELIDAMAISHNNLLVERIEKYLENQGNEKPELIKLLSDIKEEHNYSEILLTTLEGELLSSTGQKIDAVNSLIKNKINQAVNTESITVLDLHKDSSYGEKIHLSFISPVVNKKNEPISVLVFLYDAKEFLYPLIQYWPLPTLSSETLLYRVESDSILYLNELKLQKDAALKLRLPLTRKDLPAVQGALGFTGIFDGKDYRGVDVLAYISPITGTPWFFVAKIDKSELFEGLNSELLAIIVITLFLILITGTGLSFFYSHRQRNIYKELYHKEKELWQSQEKFKVTIDSLGEGVITADTNGKIQYLNKMAEDLTGWNHREAKGRKLGEIYSVKNENTGKKENNILDKVLKQGIVKELANHTLLVSKSGKEIPVMDTGAPIHDNGGSIIGLVLTFQDETEKRRNLKNLAESERRFRSSLDNMIEGCQILDFDWRYLYINDAAAKHNRRPKEELLGNKYMDMWPGIEKTEVFTVINKCLIERVDYIMENEFIFPDGSIGWFELKIQPIPDGVFILSYDITSRKRAENEHKKLSLAIIHSPVSVVITDIKGNIEYVNPKFSETTGYSFDEIIGRNPRFLKSGTHSNEFYKNIWDTILSGKEWQGEIQNKNKNGELYWDYVKISPILNENGNITHFVELKEDITARKTMLNDLIAAKEKAEEINKLKSHFFANMSHELRTPFVGIMGYAELLSETLINPEDREMAQGILTTSKRMKETLTKILSLSKFEFNGIEVADKEINVVDMINSVYKQFSAAAIQKKLSFSAKINFESLFIETDELLFSEILKNLVSNAIIYTNEGTVEIHANKQIKNSQDILVIKVVDTGIGIPKDRQEIVWEEFRQVSEGLTRSFQGTGLGLSIAKKYTELLGGIIYLESEENKGTAFTFELPIKNVIKKENIPLHILNENKNQQEIQPITNNQRKKKILHIEDDISTIDVFNRALSKIYEIESAESAEVALSKIKGNIFDVILMDINLGQGINGIELTKEIRKIPNCAGTPIIAVTAYASDKDQKEFLSQGMSHYIAKPFMMKELLTLLEAIISTKKE